MENIKSFLSSSLTKLILFLLTLAIGISASAFFLFKSSSPDVKPIEIKQTTENQPAQNFQVENNFFEQSETVNQDESPKVVQSEIIDFPVNGRVIVESVEEIGKFSQMVFRSEKTGKVLFRSSIEDEDKWLIPEKDGYGNQPDLRFLKINSEGFKSPMIMSVGVYHGGSDSAFYLIVFSEKDGKISRLNNKTINTAIQGGYYLGFLNKKFGYGLAVWSFIWGDGIDEIHYSQHHYDVEIYNIQNGNLKRTFHKITKKMYDSDEVVDSLLELGIKVTDQRKEMPEIKDSLF